MEIGVKERTVKVPVYEIGRPGKTAYELWLDAGNVGSLDNFFKNIVNRTTKIYDYDNQTEMVILHQIGKRAIVQCVEQSGALYEASVIHLNLDTVKIETLSQKQLTVIIQ